MPGDTIEVDYSPLGPDGPPFRTTVDRQGAVHLPMGVGAVHVQGLSLDEAAAAITKAYLPFFFRTGQQVSRFRQQPPRGEFGWPIKLDHHHRRPRPAPGGCAWSLAV